MLEKIKIKKWMLKSLYSNQIKFNSLSKSSVENILTFDCSLKAVSSDQIAQFRNNARAKYGSSLVTSLPCGETLFASDKNSLYSFLEYISISSSNKENKNINSDSSIPENFIIFFLSFSNSSKTKSGETILQSLFNNSSIKYLLTESDLKKENNIVASITNNFGTGIFNHSPCLLATLCFNSSESLSACLSVNLLLDKISSAIENFSLLKNCFTTLSKANSNLPFNSTGTLTLKITSAILTSKEEKDIELYKSFGLTSAEIRSEYLKHSLVINENNYLTYYAGNLTLNTSINPSKWYHASATYNDNGEANLFLDGINVQSDYNGAKLKSNLYKAWIGSWNGLTNEFNGTIDNVAIYSRALTTETIKQHYERGLKTYSLQRLRTTSTKEQWNKTIFTNLRIVE